MKCDNITNQLFNNNNIKVYYREIFYYFDRINRYCYSESNHDIMYGILTKTNVRLKYI